MSGIGYEVRQAVRFLRRAPAVSLAIVLLIALGSGVNVAIFSVADHLLFRRLPVPAPEELVNLSSPGPRPGGTSANSGLGGAAYVFSYPLFRDIEALPGPLSGVAAHRDFAANVAVDGRAEPTTGWLVSGDYFPVLQLQPAVGRLFTRSDDRSPGTHPLVVVSHRWWETRLDADPAIVGRRIVVNGQPMTVIGVAPPTFVGTTLEAPPEIFVPLAMAGMMRPDWSGPSDRQDHWLYVFGRLRGAATREQAEAAINVPFQALLRDVELPIQRSGMGDDDRARFVERRLLLESGAHGQRPERTELGRLALLLGVVATGILLIACANAANLLLARGAARSAEFAVRLSVGASRVRLVRVLLIESALLAGAGGSLGVLLAGWMAAALTPLLPGLAAFEFALTFKLLGVSLAVSAATVFLIGLYPAIFTTRAAVASTVRVSHRSPSRLGDGGFRTTMTAVQFALSLALLVLAGLFTKSLINVTQVDLGFDTDRIVTFRLRPERSGYSRPRAQALVRDVERQLAGLPGVESVTTSTVPLIDGFGWFANVTLEGGAPLPESPATADVGPGYFATLGIPLIAGREFAEADDPQAPRVAVVNQSFARMTGFGAEIVGRYFGLGAGRIPIDIQIVGVAADARYSDARTDAPPQFYLPYRQMQRFDGINVYVRTSGPSDAVLASIRSVVGVTAADVPIDNLRSMADQVRGATEHERSLTILSGLFSLLAVFLAAVGLHGVLSYAVAQRRHEIAIRIALGAEPRRVIRLLLAQLGRIAVPGFVAGLAASFAAARLAQSMLFGIEGLDISVIAAATIGLSGVALGASTLPVRRAVRIEPAALMRE